MLDALKSLKEKIEWTEQYLQHISQVSSKTAEILYKATQMPRKRAWNDPMIFSILSFTDKKRVAYDELTNLYNTSVLSEIVELKETIQEEFESLISEKQKVSEQASTYYVELQRAKDAYKESLLSDKVDRWLSYCDLRFRYKRFLDENKNAELVFKSKSLQSEKVLDFYEQRFESIVCNFFRIQRNHFSTMFNILEYNIESQSIQRFENSQKMYDCSLEDLSAPQPSVDGDFDSRFAQLLCKLNTQVFQDGNNKIESSSSASLKNTSAAPNSPILSHSVTSGPQNAALFEFITITENGSNDSAIVEDTRVYVPQKNFKTFDSEITSSQPFESHFRAIDKKQTLFYNGFEEHRNEDVFISGKETSDEEPKYIANSSKPAISVHNDDSYMEYEDNSACIASIPAPIKHGIYRVRKNKTDPKIMFIALLNNHIHFFDVEKIITNSSNLNERYRVVLEKILENRQKSFLNFFETKTKKRTLDYQEEVIFKQFVDEVLEQEDLILSLEGDLGFMLEDKLIKIDKDKHELIVYDKKQSVFSALFSQNIIRIKPIILKDLYELWFGIQKENFTSRNILNLRPFKYPKAAPKEVIYEIENTTGPQQALYWDAVRDPENPWEENSSDIINMHIPETN